jgi:hypothetical protein
MPSSSGLAGIDVADNDTKNESERRSNIEKAMKTKRGHIHIDVCLLFTHVE